MTQASLMETDFPPVAPYLSETQQSIYDWTLDVFGKVASPVSTLIRAQEELVELLTAIVNEDSDSTIAEEAADVMILLYRYAGSQGIKLTWDTEWATTSIMASAAAANTILARLIAGSTIAKPATSRPTTTDQQCGVDLHWVASHMARVCEFLHRDINAEVECKMRINRLRKWTVNKSGTGKHVEEATDSYMVLAKAWGVTRSEAKARFWASRNRDEIQQAYAIAIHGSEDAAEALVFMRERGPFGNLAA